MTAHQSTVYRNRHPALLLTAAACLLLPLSLHAGYDETVSNRIRLDTREASEPGALRGTVTGGPNRAKLQGATVAAGGVSTRTRSDGKYSLSPLSAAEYTVTVSASGYVTKERDISIEQGRTERLNVHLEKVPVEADYPVVVSVDSKYPGAFPVMSGEAVTNTYTARVQWNGSPGTVTFEAPNRTKTIDGTTRDAYLDTEFNMGTAFNPSLDRRGNPLRVTATNGEGMTSARTTLYPFVFDIPDWALNLPGVNLKPTSASGGYGFDIEAAFPANPVQAKTTIPDFVPFIGGTFGLNSTQVTLDGSFSSAQYAGRIVLAGESGFQAGEMGEVSGSAGGGVEFVLADVWEVDGVFLFKISGTLRGKMGVLQMVPLPPVQAFALTPPGIWINDRITLFAEVAPEIGAEVGVGLVPEFNFKGTDLEAGVGITGGVEIDFKLATGRGYVGGKPKVLMHFPADPEWFKSAEIDFVTGVEITTWVPFVPDLSAEKVWHVVLYDSAARASAAAERFHATRGADDLQVRAEGDVLVVTKALRAETNRVMRGPRNVRGVNIFHGDVQVGTASIRPAPNGEDSSNQPLRSDRSDPVFIENTFSRVDPAVAVDGSKDLLVFVQDDPGKEDLQSTEIAYSFRDGGEWSAPAAITDDTHLDASPQVGFDADGNAVTVWLRSRSDNLTDPETAAADIELAYSMRDADSGEWSAPVFLTDSTYLDFAPRLCRGKDGSLLLVWGANEGNQTIGSPEHPTRLLARTWDADSKSWDAAATVIPASEGAGVGSFTAAWSGTAGEVVYSNDLDGDASTSSDAELFHVSFDGSVWSAPVQLTDDTATPVADTLPEAIYTSAGDLTLTWLRGSQLVLAAGLDVADAKVVRERGTSTGLAGYSLARDSADNLFIVWPDDLGGQADLHYRVYDRARGVWGEDGKLTDDMPMEKALSTAFTADGHLLLAYGRTDINHEDIEVDLGTRETVTIEDVPRDGETDLILHDYQVGCDLQVTGITLDPANPAPGEEAEFTVEVRNFGDAAQDNVEVALYDGDPEADGEQIGVLQALSETLAGQSAGTVSWTWTVPDANTSHRLTAVVDPDNRIAEVVDDNNSTAKEVVLADIVVTGMAANWVADDTYELRATVENRGVVGSGPFTVRFAAGNDERGELGSRYIQGVAADWEDEVTLEWDASDTTLPLTVRCQVIPENDWTELDAENNAESLLLRAPAVLGLSAPQNFTARAYINRIELQWDDVGAGEDGYRILRGEPDGNVREIDFVEEDVTGYVDESVTVGQTYVYSVFAYNGAGAGPRSETVESQPLEDSDDDGLPDTFEQDIIDADPDDDIAEFADVQPDDDFDGDGFPNGMEYGEDTDATCDTCHSAGWMWTLELEGTYKSAVTFGMTPDATDDWDAGIDMDCAETPPEGFGGFSFYNDALTYQRDIRAEAEQAEWFANAIPLPETDITVRWSVPTSLPDGKTVILDEVTIAGESVVGGLHANMLEESELIIPAGEETRYLVIRYSGGQATVELPLLAGWNLVSLPISPEPSAVESVFADTAFLSRAPGDFRRVDGRRGTVHTGTVWRWDTENQAYAAVSDLAALEGVWVFVETDAVVEISGTPLDASDWQWGFQHGWNLVGPPVEVPVPDEASLRGHCWSWDAESATYKVSETLSVKNGYWLNWGGDETLINLDTRR